MSLSSEEVAQLQQRHTEEVAHLRAQLRDALDDVRQLRQTLDEEIAERVNVENLMDDLERENVFLQESIRDLNGDLEHQQRRCATLEQRLRESNANFTAPPEMRDVGIQTVVADEVDPASTQSSAHSPGPAVLFLPRANQFELRLPTLALDRLKAGSPTRGMDSSRKVSFRNAPESARRRWLRQPETPTPRACVDVFESSRPIVVDGAGDLSQSFGSLRVKEHLKSYTDATTNTETAQRHWFHAVLLAVTGLIITTRELLGSPLGWSRSRLHHKDE